MRKASLVWLLLAGCGAPTFDVEMVALDARMCRENELKLVEALDYWNERGADYCYVGCRVADYGPDVQSLGHRGLRGLGEQPSDTLSFYVAYSIERDGSFAFDGIIARNVCRHASAVAWDAEWPAYAHELGHFMGLEHVDDVQNIMYKASRDTARQTAPGQEEQALRGLSLMSGLCGTGQRIPYCPE